MRVTLFRLQLGGWLSENRKAPARSTHGGTGHSAEATKRVNSKQQGRVHRTSVIRISDYRIPTRISVILNRWLSSSKALEFQTLSSDWKLLSLQLSPSSEGRSNIWWKWWSSDYLPLWSRSFRAGGGSRMLSSYLAVLFSCDRSAWASQQHPSLAVSSRCIISIAATSVGRTLVLQKSHPLCRIQLLRGRQEGIRDSFAR